MLPKAEPQLWLEHGQQQANERRRRICRKAELLFPSSRPVFGPGSLLLLPPFQQRYHRPLPTSTLAPSPVLHLSSAMLDPMTAIGLASSIVSFVGFSIDLVSGTCEVYKSLTGTTTANAHVDDIVQDLEKASATLLVRKRHGGDEQAIEQAVLDLGEKCHRKCIELVVVLQKLKVKDPKTVWVSFRAAWLSRRKNKDIAQLHNDLRDYRAEILLWLGQMQLYVYRDGGIKMCQRIGFFVANRAVIAGRATHNNT